MAPEFLSRIASLEPPGATGEVAGLSPDAERLLIRVNKPTPLLRVVDFSGAVRSTVWPTGAVVKATLSPDGGEVLAVVAVSDKRRVIQVYRLDAAEVSAPAAVSRLFDALADAEWLTDGSILAAGQTGNQIWTLVTNTRDFNRPLVKIGHFTKVREVRCTAGCVAVWSEADDSGSGRVFTYPVQSGSAGAQLVPNPLLTVDNKYAGRMLLVSGDGRHAVSPIGDDLWSVDPLGGQPRHAEIRGIGFFNLVGGDCVVRQGVGRRSDEVAFHRLTVDGPIPWGETSYWTKADDIQVAIGTEGTFVAATRGAEVTVYRLTDPDILDIYSTDDGAQQDAAQRIGERRLAAGIPHLAHLIRQRASAAPVAVLALEQIGSDDAVDALLAAGPDEPHAQDALRRIDATYLAGAVRRCLARHRRSAVRAAARLLARRPDPAMTAELCALLNDWDPDLRTDAAAALAVRADTAALPALVATIGDQDETVARQAWHAVLATLPSAQPEPGQPEPDVLAATAPYLAAVIRSGHTDCFPQAATPSARVIDSIAAALVHPSQGADQVLNALARLGRGGRHRDAAIVLCLLAAERSRRQGDADAARAFWSQAAADAATADIPEIEWRAQGAIGDLYAAAQRWRSADSHYAAAERVIDRMWARLLGDPDDRRFFADKAHLYEQAMLCRLRLGRVACALDTLEKAKTRFLGDLIARRHSRPRAGLAQVADEFWRASGQRRPMTVAAGDEPTGGAGDEPSDGSVREIVGVALESSTEPDAPVPVGLAGLYAAAGAPGGEGLRMATTLVLDMWSVAAALQSGDYPPAVEDGVRELVGELDGALTDMRAAAEGSDPGAGPDAVQRYLDAADALARTSSRVASRLLGGMVAALPGWALWEMRGWENDYVAGTSEASSYLVAALHEAISFITGRAEVWAAAPATATPTVEDQSPSTVDRPVPVFTAAVPTASVTADAVPHPTTTTALERHVSTRWQHATRIARGETVGTAEAARLLLRTPGTAVLEFALTRRGTVIYAIADGVDLNAEPLPDLTGWAVPTVFNVPNMTSLDLDRWIFGGDGWMTWYDRRRHSTETWQRKTDECLRSLYDALFRPLQPWLAKHRIGHLLVIPHRGLHLLPVSAWYEGAGRRRRYVGDRFDVSYAPSLTLLDICRQRVDTADRAAPRRPLALLDPTGDLPMTRLDGLAIHPTPDSGRILTGANATSGRWADAARDADPCHYAGHAAYSRDDPLESRIELADGALVLGSLFDEHVPVPAGGNVVLSGCETAMTDHTEPADEHLGIASGFLFAGSAAVLSTQWAVAEAPAAILVDQYYTHLRRDEPARALRIAQRALRKASRADLAHLLDRADRLAGMDVLDERTRQRLRTDRQALRGTRIDYSHPVHWAAYTATGYTPPGGGPDDQVTNRHTTT